MFYQVRRDGPRVWVSFSGLPQGDREFDALLDELTALYTHAEAEAKTRPHGRYKFSILFDTRRLGTPPLRFAQGMAKWIEVNRARATTYLRCTAVVGNVAVRAFLDLTLTFAKPSAPMQVCGNLAEAVEYLQWKKA